MYWRDYSLFLDEHEIVEEHGRGRGRLVLVHVQPLLLLLALVLFVGARVRVWGSALPSICFIGRRRHAPCQRTQFDISLIRNGEMGFGFHETYVLSFRSVLYLRVQPTWLLYVEGCLCYANTARSLRSKHLVTVYIFARVNTSLSQGPNREFDLTPLHSADVGIADAATFPAQEENKVVL